MVWKLLNPKSFKLLQKSLKNRDIKLVYYLIIVKQSCYFYHYIIIQIQYIIIKSYLIRVLY